VTRGGRLGRGLDFAQPQRGMRHGTSWAGWAWLAAGLLLTVWLVQDYARLDARRSALQAELRQASLRQERQEGAALPAAQAAELRFADETLRLAALPWEAVFQDIEAAASPEIVLLHLQPQGRSRDIRIAGEARDFEALSAYLARLDSRPGLSGAQLLGHQLTDARAPLKFEALVRWRGR
jgi:Tfp pilus assembly protein PilN